MCVRLKLANNGPLLLLLPPSPILNLKVIIIILLILLNQLTATQLQIAQSADSGSGSSDAFIKLTRFLVPQKVRLGEPTRLACIYEIRGETLHAMKLFKDGKEFYRFTPNSEDRKLVFNLPGINVDEIRSNEREVYLKGVTRKSAGRYKCQVSVEDTFKSISAERTMEVVDRTATPAAIYGDGRGGAGSASLGTRQAHKNAVQQQQQHLLQQNQRQIAANHQMSMADNQHQQPSNLAVANQPVRTTAIILLSLMLTQFIHFL